MAKKTSLVEEFFSLAAEFPWWINFILAISSYLILSSLSQTSAVSGVEGATLSTFPSQLEHTFAKLLTPTIPLLFIISGIISLVRNKQKPKPSPVRDFETIATKPRSIPSHHKKLETRQRLDLHNLDWQEFEVLIAQVFKRKGFKITKKGGAGPDGGIDIILTRESDIYLVQCKHWRSRQVGVATVRELYGVMAAMDASGGYVVTSGTYTKAAKQWAYGREIDLIAGPQLNDWLVRSKLVNKKSNSEHPPIPLCPSCKLSMVKRIAKQGKHTGKEFWGCKSFPKCRGTRDI